MPENHVMNHTSWRHGLTRYQWLVLLVAWLGWVFDSMDATIYAIVLHPALAELLRTSVAGGPVTHEVIGWYGGLIFSIFLIGWAVGGVLFGIVADHFGRTKTLIITILVYSLFTGLAALSDNWWHLAIYRFVTALGIGGEWAAGAVIVAEVWPEEKRAKAAGVGRLLERRLRRSKRGRDELLLRRPPPIHGRLVHARPERRLQGRIS